LAEGGDAFGEVGVTLPQEPVAPREHGGTQEDTDSDATGRADPIVVERIFEEKGDGHDQSENADSVEPATGD